jgi:hypothetical protein
MPYITVSWVSSLRSMRRVGSSSRTRASAVESLSSSPLVLGSTAMPSSGSGIGIAGSTTGSSLAENVSPVVVWFSLATAPISPAGTSDRLSWSFPFSVNSCPTRSSVFFVAL